MAILVVRVLALFPVLLALFCLLLQIQDPSLSLESTSTSSGQVPTNTNGDLSEAVLSSLTDGQSTPGEGKLETYLEEFYHETDSIGLLPKGKEDGPKVGIVTTTAASVDVIKVWMRYHRSIGFSAFYLFVNGQVNHPQQISELNRWAGVKVFPNDAKLKYREAHSRAWNETWLSAFFNKPCNNELFVMQSLNMEVGIEQAIKDEVDWLFHLDTDELVYPSGTKSYNVQEFLQALDPDVDTVIFPNYEGLAERDTVEDPFVEVSLFKRSFSHVNSEQYFAKYKAVSKGNPNYFTTYGNGKSAAKVQPFLRSNGAHRWYIYGKKPKEATSEEPTVLHYVYNKYADLKGRRDRCDCAPTEEDVKRCFILPFDRQAFLASSLKDDRQLRQYFRDHLVWEDHKLVRELLKSGLFVRIHTPQVMMHLYKQMQDAGLDLADPQESKRTVMDTYEIPDEW